MSRLRVIHLIAATEGVAWPWLTSLIREQARRGYDVRVAVPRGTSSSLSDVAAVVPVDELPIELPRLSQPLTLIARLFTIARYLRRHRPDVVQYHLFPAMILGRLAGWLADVPIRLSMSPSPLLLESPRFRKADAGTAFADSAVIATCNRTRELYIEHGVDPKRVHLIYYSADTEAFDPALVHPERVRDELGLREGQPLIGLVAYFYPPMPAAHAPPYLRGRAVKGHEVLIAAAPRVLARYPDAKFLLVGKGAGAEGAAYEQTLRDSVRDAALADTIVFAGARDDVPDVLAACDIALHTSLIENLGGSIEALTLARPFVATRVGGLVDTVIHERTGLLVESGNSEELADAIVRLLDDRTFATRLGEAGRLFMKERFTVQRTADDLGALYGSFAGSRGYRTLVSLGRAIALPFRMALSVVR